MDEPCTAANQSSQPLEEAPWIDLSCYDQSWFNPGRPKWFILLWWLVQALAFPLTLHAAHAPRRLLLRLFGAKVGRAVVIRPTARFTYPWKIAIGDYSWIGDDVVFYSLDTITVGRHCVISQKSYLCTGSHRTDDVAFGLQTAPIIIGNGVWLAADCFVAPGVCVGANTVVGARSSIYQSLPPRHLCFGNPCQPVKIRSAPETSTEEFQPQSRN
ncbi:MAG TPA: hormogonium polysaccharide biosynthesis acetyltransferase HpsU [Trichocoleus sp.]